jgi:signal peptidase I
MGHLASQQTKRRALWIAFAVVVGACAIAVIIAIPSAVKQLRHTRSFSMSNDSMQPTLYSGDLITADPSYYSDRPAADGDIIVFHHDDVNLAKRVSAVGGETIEGKDGKLIRNGIVLAEPYLKIPDEPSGPSEETFSPRKIPEGQIFVTGDWRSRSLDSRDPSYAPVRVSDVIGKVVYIYGSSHAGQIGRKF